MLTFDMSRRERKQAPMQIFFFFYFSHFFRPDVRNHDTLALASKDKQNTFVVNN